MKILFTITVVIAGVYLFIQQEGINKISQYLPQYQIDKSAESLLANVNKNVNEQVEKQVNQRVEQELEQFKSTLISEKNARIQILEKKLEDLQTQFSATQSQPLANDIEQENTALLTTNKPSIQNIPNEPKLAKTQYLTGKTSLKPNESVYVVNKQKAIKRQANLQDIAERMNKTSLLALTH